MFEPLSRIREDVDPSPWSQLRGMVSMYALLQARQRKRICVLVFVPMLAFLVLWGTTASIAVMPVYQEEQYFRTISGFNPVPVVCVNNTATEGVLTFGASPFHTCFSVEIGLAIPAEGVDLGTPRTNSSRGSGFLGAMGTTYEDTWEEYDFDSGNWYLQTKTRNVPKVSLEVAGTNGARKMLAEMDRVVRWQQECAADVFASCQAEDHAREETLPRWVMNFNQMDDRALDAVVQAGEMDGVQGYVYSGLSTDEAQTIAVSRLLHAYSVHVLGRGNHLDESLSRLMTMDLPYFDTLIPVDAFGAKLLELIFIPFLCGMAFVSVVSQAVFEREKRLLSIYYTAGLRVWVYWTGVFLFGVLVSLFLSGGIGILGQMAGMSFFTETDNWVIFFLFLLFSTAQTAFALCFSTFFRSEGVATNVSMLLLLTQNVVSLPLNLFGYGAETPPGIFYLYPFFAFARGTFLISQGIIDPGRAPLHTPAAMRAGTPMSDVLASLFGTTLLYLVLAVYLSLVRTDRGDWRHPLSPFPVLFDYLRQAKNNFFKKKRSTVGIELTAWSSHDGGERTEGEPMEGEPMVVLHNLRKKFGDFVAVDDISLTFRRGECFALLGENGAGKTTTINMISGLETITSGSVEVLGVDVATHLDEARRYIGVVPQFDILHPTLTVWETLIFYARVKGVHRKREQAHVKQVIAEMGLAGAKDRMAGDLSGGMARRLSLAIALTGGPEVVFIDELSSGLDAGTRMAMWDVVRNVMKDRCLVLSTHTMQEVDVLCSRIAIMREGKVIASGELNELKRQNGRYYKIIVSASFEHIARAKQFVRSVCPSAVLRSEYCGVATFQVDGDVVLSDVFAQMERGKSKYGIRDWSMNASTMDDIFFTVNKKHTEEEEEEEDEAREEQD